MASFLSTEGLARVSARHPWRTVGVWLVVILAAAVVSGTLFASATTNAQEFTFDPESVQAQQLLEDSGLREEAVDTELVVIQHPTLTVDDPQFESAVSDIHSRITALGPGVLENPATIPTYYTTGLPTFISSSRNATFIPVAMSGDSDVVADNVEALLQIADEANQAGFEVGVAGPAAIGHDFNEVSERDLLVGETIGIGAALVILLLVFRAVGSAWIPLVVAIFAIIMAVAASALIGQVYKLSFFVVNMITMIGLAVGIDYTLFIVARFREERANGVEKIAAVTRAGSTASRAVFFSGLTVVFALLGMLIVPTNIFFSLGLGAVLVVIFAIMLSLTLLPAILSIVGDKVNAWQIPFLPGGSVTHEDVRSGFWYRTTYAVLKRPVLFLLLGGGLLVALTIPYLGINTGFNGVQTLPDEFRSKRAFELLIAEFPAAFGDSGTTQIVVNGDAAAQQDAVARLSDSLEQMPAVSQVQPYEVSENRQVGVLPVFLSVAADSDAANEAIRTLRGELIPAAGFTSDVLVSGNTAFNVDFFDLVDTWTPIVVAFVLALSFVLLTLVFRSLIVPIKAIILNLLSVGSAYGLLVLVFQRGWGADLLGFQQVEAIEAWIPLFLFSVLFGLSMDYEVFLLSRIRERFDQTQRNEESVAFGLRSTASIITGAALIMVAVFAGFALGDLVMFQQLGFGLGVAILVDATVVRTILVPSTMKLLGDRNWYLPSFLRWLPDVRVEAAGHPAHVGSTSIEAIGVDRRPLHR